ncbi:DUF4145 domain-containing protein [Lonepinella sp. BR2474]|uniref:DUF4145 domain-containing protein n=1 Tax=Lonepinella sp. BR2474 TaxID=3434548 RepID=UPI003F6E35F1
MITFGYNCPHCGVVNGGFEVRSFYENKKHDNLSIFSLLAICNTCDGSIISDIAIFDNGIRKEKIDGFRHQLNHKDYYYNLYEVYTGKIKFFPDKQNNINIPQYLPDSVEEELMTAEQLFADIKLKPNYLKPSGNAYRTVLERALCELSDNDNQARLNKRIEKLFEEGKLTIDLKNFALHIRSLSAEASHTYNEFTQQELEELRLFTQLFLQYVFTLPAMIPDESKQVKGS